MIKISSKTAIFQISTLLIFLSTVLATDNSPEPKGLKHHGFKFPNDYTPEKSNQYIHTRVHKGTKTSTTGNWESDVDYSIFPKYDTIPLGSLVVKHGVTSAEKSKAASLHDEKIDDMIKFLKKNRDYYLKSFINYESTGTFSPQLDGYIWYLDQRSCTYTMAGKCFIYVSIIALFVAQVNQGYFKTVIPEENPRSLSNRVHDRFFGMDSRYKKINNKSTIACYVFGVCIITACCIVFWWAGEKNQKVFDETSRELQTTTNNLTNRIKELTKDLTAINNKNVVIPRSLHRGETQGIETHFSDQDQLGKTFQKKASDFTTNIIHTATLIKPMKACLIFLIVMITFAMSVYSTKKFTPKVNMISAIMMILIGGWAIIFAGHIISDVYQFQEICEFLQGQSPDSNVHTKQDSKNSMITLGLSEYFYCYDFGFQEKISKQVGSISTAESALFKSIVEDLKSINKSKNLSLSIPEDITELQGQKTQIDSLSDDLFFSAIHLNVINELEAIKAKVIRIPECNIMGPFFDSARVSWCTDGLNNGLIMFYSMFGLFIGCLFLVAAYFQNEIIIKFKNEKKLSEPSQFGKRFQNSSLRSLASFVKQDKGQFSVDYQGDSNKTSIIQVTRIRRGKYVRWAGVQI